MKTIYKVLIEETIVQSFEVEAGSIQEAFEDAELNYKNGKLVQAPGELEEARVKVEAVDGSEATDWEDI